MNEEKDWVLVYETNTEISAEFIKQNLENNGIPTNILSQVDSTRQFTVGYLAIVKIFVLREDIEKAIELINEIDSGQLSINENDIVE